MRKKTHILLASYLIGASEYEDLYNHKKSFIIGSVLPDCKPSFITTRHTMDDTFKKVSGMIGTLCYENRVKGELNNASCRKLGEITHYIADYFTFPHNDIFDGSVKDHCIYEKELKFAMREYVHGDGIYHNERLAEKFKSPSQLCRFIKNLHDLYVKGKSNIENDCRFIVALCHIVVETILNFIHRNKNIKYMEAVKI